MQREINGKTYTFRMTRKGIRAAEKAGMRMSVMPDTPMDAVYYLWYAALYTEHPMTMGKSDELLDTYLDSSDCPESFSDILESLMDEYTEVFNIAAE